jgi:hypothetical protein
MPICLLQEILMIFVVVGSRTRVYNHMRVLFLDRALLVVRSCIAFQMPTDNTSLEKRKLQDISKCVLIHSR